jgi:hypothetical protein
MPRGEKLRATPDRQTDYQRDTAPADFPAELGGEFNELPKQLAANIGTVATLAVSGGGYFGFSCTDDGGSVRLVIRHGPLELDRRFYAVGKLEQALAYCVTKLRDSV